MVYDGRQPPMLREGSREREIIIREVEFACGTVFMSVKAHPTYSGISAEYI